MLFTREKFTLGPARTEGTRLGIPGRLSSGFVIVFIVVSFVQLLEEEDEVVTRVYDTLFGSYGGGCDKSLGCAISVIEGDKRLCLSATRRNHNPTVLRMTQRQNTADKDAI